MGALMAATDWAATPLGPVEHWPQSLRTTVSLCLSSHAPMMVVWGEQHVLLYNDARRLDTDSTAEGGRGLQILSALCSDWGSVWTVPARSSGARSR